MSEGMTEKVEEWRPINGYEGKYDVGDLGRVRGIDRLDARGRKWKGRVLRPAAELGQAGFTSSYIGAA
jgi:hypothetical protein